MALDNFIGQASAKDQVRSLIDVSNYTGGLLPHLLLSGPPEMGKATFANALVTELGVAACRLPTNLPKRLDFIGVVSALGWHDVLFTEEIQELAGEARTWVEDALAKSTLEIVVGIGAGARTVSLDLQPYTLVATSSKPWQIPISLRRWFTTVEFVSYSIKEMEEIVTSLASSAGLDFQPAAARLVASHCDGTPGNASALLTRIGAHYERLVTGVHVDEDLARYVLGLLGYDHEDNPNVGLADRLRVMSGTEFEEFVANLFTNLGYVTQLTPGSGDHGVDILIRKAGSRGAVQCKRWNDPVGEPVLRDFLGSMLSAGATVGYVAATTTFTDQAQAFAHKHSIQLLDLDALLRMAGPGAENPPRRSLFS